MGKKLETKTSKLPPRPRRKTDLVENIGRVLINLGQVVFATLFLGGVLRGEVPQYLMVLSGIIGATILIVLGLLLSAKEQYRKE
jgi:putative Mn2+ efflux pump MntP